IARGRAAGAAAALLADDNPLGISEADLPLFFGDVQGTNSRYFASSDYLLDTWAVPAVKTAQDALAVARGAWIEQARAKVQSEVAMDDRDRRLDAIASPAVGTLIQACGPFQFGGRDADPRDV